LFAQAAIREGQAPVICLTRASGKVRLVVYDASRGRCASQLPRLKRRNRHPPDTGTDDVNRPSSALGLLLGFLALTMFAVSSTSRSTSVKPAAGPSDRATIRRQAALARLSAISADAQSVAAADALIDDALCTPDVMDLDQKGIPAGGTSDADRDLQSLQAPAAIRLTPVRLDVTRDDLGPIVLAQLDGRTDYDPVYDQVVLGFVTASTSARLVLDENANAELSAADIALVFRSLVSEKSTSTRSATTKPQRRASLEGLHTSPANLVRAL